MKALLAFLGLSQLAAGAMAGAQVQLQLPPIFSDGVVLQRDVGVPVWGTAPAGAEVTVSLGAVSGNAVADATGRWRVVLPAMSAGGPFVMTVASGAQQLTVTDVYVGDVWLASGQSNMEWPLIQAAGGPAAAAAANDPKIRQFKVAKGLANEPSDALPAGSAWTPATSLHAGNFSAVAYFFARNLREHVDVPIGILNVSYGGSRIETWMSDEMLGYDESVRLANGEPERQPTVAYNKMIHPLLSYPIKGFLWYQGESNADTMDDALAYRTQFQAFIEGWRALWGMGDLPFLWVQLPGYGTPTGPATDAQPPTWDAWPQLRAGQSAARSLPNTAEVVTIDLGDEDIHPRVKEPVGARLALAARRVAYGEDLVYSGPRYRSNTLREDGSIEIAFDHVGGGLLAQTFGGAVRPVAVAGADGRFVWADAYVDDDRLIVASGAVAEPARVRFAWEYHPAYVDLYNVEGLPAAPFEAEVNPGFKIGSFGATRTAIEPGQSTVLSWKVFNAAAVTLDGVAVDAEGSRTVSPAETTTYTLEAVNADDPSDVVTAEVTVEVLDPDQINRAAGRPASASTVESCCGADRGPAFAVDGDPETRWSSAWQTGDATTPRDPNTDDDPDDEWIAVDLGETIDVERVILSWEAAYGSSYDVELSYDGYLWRTVREVRGGDGGEDDLVFDTPPRGRYVRIHGVERATEYGYSLWEIAVYGKVSTLQPPVLTAGTAAGNVVDVGAATTLVAHVGESDETVRNVVFYVNGAAYSHDMQPPYEASWTPPAPGAYVVTFVAVVAAEPDDVDNAEVQSPPLTVYAVAPGDMVRFEAEGASFTGQASVLSAPAASGGAYLEMRDAWTLTFDDIEVAQTGTYLLSIRYQLTFESPKTQYLVVNGDTLEAVEFTAPSTTAWLQRGIEVPLREGANEVAVHGFWNWMSFDYVALEREALAVGAEGPAGVPEAVALAQNFPNPFNPATVIGYTLRQGEHVRLDVFDVTGRRVATLVDAVQPAGVHAVRFDAAQLASGVYLYRLHAGPTVLTRRMTLLR